MGFSEKFLSWLDGFNLEAGEDATTTAAHPTSATVDPDPPKPAPPDPVPAPAPQEARPVESTQTVATSAESEELIRLRAENRRLLLARIQDAGKVFASQRTLEQRAFPGEEPHIVAAYVQAALDDERLGTEADAPSRVQLLSNLFAARVSISHLTAEGLGTAVAQVISHRASAPDREKDPVSADRKAELLGHSPLGKTVRNGTSS